MMFSKHTSYKVSRLNYSYLLSFFLGVPVSDTNGTIIRSYDCQLGNSSLAVFSQGNGSALAASIVGIVVLFLTVAYMWYVAPCPFLKI